MKNNTYVSVIVVAAGQGTRMNLDKKKQYIEIKGETILSRTIRAFQVNDLVDEIILVVNSDEIFFCKNEIVQARGFSKVISIVAGGYDRQESVYNGLKEVNEECSVVLIHDGARPFVDEQIIHTCIEGALSFEAVCAAVPVKDTVKTVDEEGYITITHNRAALWAVQTPQAFSCPLILEAHLKAKEEGFRGTDDSVLVERLGKKVKLVMGSYNNIKITTQEDLVFAEAIAREID